MSASVIVVLFLCNFVILSTCFGVMVYIYYRKQKELTVSLQCQFQAEEKRLELLTGELSAIADTLAKKIEKKEKDLGFLLEKIKYTEQKVHAGIVPNVPGSDAAATRPPVTVTKIFADAEKYKDIYCYADKGMRLTDIARKTGKAKGEIELILSLRTAQEQQSERVPSL